MCASCYHTLLINKTPEHREAYLARQRRRYRPGNPEERRRDHLKRRYGLLPGDYDALLALQDGRCAVCRKMLSRLVVDHDHVTGRIRGLVCDGCNRSLAALDDKLWLVRALRYLEPVGAVAWRALALLQTELEEDAARVPPQGLPIMSREAAEHWLFNSCEKCLGGPCQCAKEAR